MRYFLIFLLCSSFGYAQETKLQLTDYHTTQITSLIPTSNNEFISADVDGKILLHDLATYSYKRTIKEADGFIVENLQMIGQSNRIFYTSQDSLFMMDIITSKILNRIPFKGKLLDQDNPKYSVMSVTTNYATHDLIIIDLEKGEVKQFETKNPVQTAYITEDNKYLFYVEMQKYAKTKDQSLVCMNLKDEHIVWEKPIHNEHKIIHLFNGRDSTEINSISFSENDQILSVFNYIDGSRSRKSNISIPLSSYFNGIHVLDRFKTDDMLVITLKGLFNTPIIINSKNEDYSYEICDVEGTHTAVLLNGNKRELVFANNLSTYFNGKTANFIVYDPSQLKVKDIYPHSSKEFYAGYFLPNDNWMVYGETSNTRKSQLKYYSSGTFYNRYNKINFIDNIQQRLDLNYPPNLDFFNKNTGKYIFISSNLSSEISSDKIEFSRKEEVSQFDLINDEIKTIYSSEDDDPLPRVVLDYNEKNQLLFLSRMHYNYSLPPLQPLKLTLIKDHKKTQLSGGYKAVKIAQSGNYFLTINENDLVEIFDSNQKKVFKYQLVKGAYIIHATDDDNFIISNHNFTQSDSTNCFDETITFELQDSGKYTVETLECVSITHIINKNNKIVYFIKNVGLLINEKLVPIYFSSPPISISLNEDASKLMISFSDGKIGIYDTSTYEELGATFHPSEKEHIFYSSKGYYFSNTDASHFLLATNAGENITLKAADQEVFKPKEVLSVFGKPNQEYVDLLSKAIKLRKEKMNLDDAYPTSDKYKEIVDEEIATTKPTLYLLSVGVSDYLQEEYSLTYADKDAIDIADLYGEVDVKTKSYYNKKFYGDKFTLSSPTQKEELDLFKYYGAYRPYSKFHSVEKENKRWLQIEGEEAFLWDFENSKIQSIKFPPEVIKQSEIDIIYEGIIINPDSDAFYLQSDLDEPFLYQYNARSNTFINVTLPSFASLEKFTFESMQAILNNRWLYFKEPDNFDSTFQVIIENVGQSENNTTYTIDFKYYKSHLNGEIVSDYIEYPKFKCASLDGKKIIYRTFDKTFIVNVENNTIPLELPIPIEYGDEVSLTSDDKLTVRKLRGENDIYKTIITTYSLDGKELYSKVVDNSIEGISIYDGKPFFINSSSSLLENNYFTEKYNEENLAPVSFEKVELQYLINEKANRDNVINSLNTFIKNVKPQDEVIVFLAGHGVLDKQNNYYFAPHNMDFSNLSKNGISFELIINKLKESPSKNKLLLMDSCHSGSTLDLAETENSKANDEVDKDSRGMISRIVNSKNNFKMSGVINSIFEDFLSTSGITILTAASGGDLAYENKSLGNGAFTHAFINSFAGLIPARTEMNEGISLDDHIIAELLNEVVRLTNGKQEPDIREINKNVEIKLW